MEWPKYPWICTWICHLKRHRVYARSLSVYHPVMSSVLCPVMIECGIEINWNLNHQILITVTRRITSFFRWAASEAAAVGCSYPSCLSLHAVFCSSGRLPLLSSRRRRDLMKFQRLSSLSQLLSVFSVVFCFFLQFTRHAVENNVRRESLGLSSLSSCWSWLHVPSAFGSCVTESLHGLGTIMRKKNFGRLFLLLWTAAKIHLVGILAKTQLKSHAVLCLMTSFGSLETLLVPVWLSWQSCSWSARSLLARIRSVAIRLVELHTMAHKGISLYHE